MGGPSDSKTTAKPTAGGPTAVRGQKEEERRRTKHGLARERAPQPGRTSGGGGGLPWVSLAVGRGTMPPEVELEPGPEPEPEPEPEPKIEVAPVAPPVVAPPPAAAPSGPLELSQPGDRLEREADEAAERVVHRLAVSPGGAPADGGGAGGGGASGGAPPPATPFAPGLMVQRASLVEVVAEAAGLTPRTETPAGLIVEDRTETLTPGQMKKGPFVARLREVVRETADRELRRAGRSADDCPYIEDVLGRFARRPPDKLERAIRKYAPEARQATRAEDYFAPVATKLGQGIATWARTGRMPEGLPDEFKPGRLSNFLEVGASIGRAAAGVGRALFKGKDGGAGKSGVDPVALSDRLGPGRPLDGGARSRMETAFGRSFGDVRIHIDEGAAKLSGELEARAFTVGPHVAFGAGEFRPGTPAGDALLAHELAHVVQQSGAIPAPAWPLDTAGSPVHERDADEAAAAATLALWGRGRAGRRRARPRLWAAPRLQRCATSIEDMNKFLKERQEAGKIGGGFYDDDKAREIAEKWSSGEDAGQLNLTARRKVLLIKEMLDGDVSGADQEQILQLLERSRKEELGLMFSGREKLDAATLQKNFGGDRKKRLENFFIRRFSGNLEEVKAGKAEPIGEPAIPIGESLPGAEADPNATITVKASEPVTDPKSLKALAPAIDKKIKELFGAHLTWNKGNFGILTKDTALRPFKAVDEGGGTSFESEFKREHGVDAPGGVGAYYRREDAKEESTSGHISYVSQESRGKLEGARELMTPHTYVHESLHAYTHPKTSTFVLPGEIAGFGSLREGLTEYFAQQVSKSLKVRIDEIHSIPFLVAQHMISVTGETAALHAYFGGNVAELEAEVDLRRGPGAFLAAVAALGSADHATAVAILLGEAPVPERFKDAKKKADEEKRKKDEEEKKKAE